MDFHIIPLDATNVVLISRQDVNQWRQGGNIADLAADVYDMVLANQGGDSGKIWDLMTAAILVDPDLCGFQSLPLQVITQEGNTSGQTAVVPGGQPNISVCLEPNVDLIVQTLADVFSGRTNDAIPAPGASAAPVFRDDFTAKLRQGWTWLDEDPSRWGITPDGWLEIMGEDGSVYATGAQSNLLCTQAPEGDFEVTVHLSADPVVDFQQATLYLVQDGGTYIAMNRGYCSLCQSGGSGVHMEYKSAAGDGTYAASTEDTDVFLQLAVQGQTVTGNYALEPEAWQSLAQMENYVEDARVCLGVSNGRSAGVDADLVGRFDFVKITGP